MNTNLRYEWIDKGTEPTQPPNPNFPNGMYLNMSTPLAPSCSIDLPCPARRMGYYVITCDGCQQRIVISTAGRADDPRFLKINCRNPARSAQ